MSFENIVRASYPKAKVLRLNGGDGPDIDGIDGLGVELPDGLKVAYQFREGYRHRAEAELLDWLKVHYGPSAL